MQSVATSETYDRPMQDFLHGEFVERFYNSFREHIPRFHFVMSLIHDLQPESILDLGCGWGTFGAMVRWKRGYAPSRVIGVDFSPTSLAFAKRYGQYDEVIEADFTVPLELPRAELVLCMEVLEHVQDPMIVAANAAKCATKNILFSCPVEDDVDGLFHVRQVSCKDLHSWVERLGLRVIRSEFVPSEFQEQRWYGWNFALCSL